MTKPQSVFSAAARSDGPSLQSILQKDPQPAPQAWRSETSCYLGSYDLPKERYLARAFHEREKEKVWSRTWQVACHVQQIPKVGDYIVYDIADRSVLVVRVAPDEIRAFYNACLHRGRQLCVGRGNTRAFRCPFHGWTWDLKGALKRITAEWDFAHVDKAEYALPEVRVATWGGFVFINFDRNAPALNDYLEGLPEEFAAWPLENRYLAGHVVKLIRCNWKIALEAFLESYHVDPTHPELVDTTGFAETQYDVYPDKRHVNRMITPMGVPGTAVARSWSQEKLAATQAKIMGMLLKDSKDQASFKLPEGMTARAFAAQEIRRKVAETGVDLSGLSDSEVIDGVQYFLFPNFVPWAGFGFPIMYRYRPNGDDHETCIMDLYILAPWPEGKPMPPAGPTTVLGLDQPMAEAAELGVAGPLYDQDMANLPHVQQGLRSLQKGVTLANYQEVRLRHLHQTLDWYLDR